MSFEIGRLDTVETVRRKVAGEIGWKNHPTFKVEVRQGGYGSWSGEPYDFKICILSRGRRLAIEVSVGDNVAYKHHLGILEVF